MQLSTHTCTFLSFPFKTEIIVKQHTLFKNLKINMYVRIRPTMCQIIKNNIKVLLKFKNYNIIRVRIKLPNSEQSYKGKVKTHNYINRQNQSTTGKL